MRPFNNYDTTQTISARAQLPVGAYICQIFKAEEKVYTSPKGEWHKLEVSFDISEGEQKDFYANDYRAQSGEDKKWKGVIRLNVPNDDGSEMDAWKSAHSRPICRLLRKAIAATTGTGTRHSSKTRPSVSYSAPRSGSITASVAGELLRSKWFLLPM